ncbi:MAG TPA: ATP-binding cassette domain-containing protein [Actinomycetota bacterium]|nr:ATP-binding cassette domain-containing protein [Actinomycetota bacterium]
MSAPIEVSGLTKVYDQPAVDDLSFAIEWGQVSGFLGPNGAGKSTTMRMILGLSRPTSGVATVDGMRFDQLERPASVVGALLDTQQFHPQRSARNHLRVYADAARIPAPQVEEVLELVELTDAADRRVGGFSLGMKQRLGLATALLGEPKILVLDEPANGLDPSGIRWLRSFLREFVSDGKAAFVSSHLLGEMALMADDVIVIARGSLVAQAPMHELVVHSDAGVRARSEEPERLRSVVESLGARAELVSHDTILVKGIAVEEVGRAAARDQIVLYGLASEEGSLEDVFLQLTGSEV